MTSFADKLEFKGLDPNREAVFRADFAALPEHVQKVITDAELIFDFRPFGSQIGIVEGKTVHLRGQLDQETSNRYRASLLGGYGLVAALGVLPHASGVAKKVFDEIAEGIRLETTREERRFLKAFSRPANIIGYYLSTSMATTLQGASLTPALTELCSLYDKAAIERAENPVIVQLPKKDSSTAPAKTYPDATDTAFVLDTATLSEPQQEYFAKLNEIIALLGLSPTAFDAQFRSVLMQQMVLLSNEASAACCNVYEPKHISKDRIDEQIQPSPPYVKRYLGALAHSFELTPKKGFPKEQERALFSHLADDFLRLQDKTYGRLLGLDPARALVSKPSPDQRERSLIKSYSTVCRTSGDEKEEVIERPRKARAAESADNIIQGYCSGKLGLDRLQRTRAMTDFSIGHIELSNGITVFNAGIVTALRVAAMKKGFDSPADAKTKKIENLISEIQTLGTQLGLHPKKHVAALTKEDRRRESEERNAAAAQRREERLRHLLEKSRTDQKSTHERALAESDIPKPYRLTHIPVKGDFYVGELEPLAALFDCRSPMQDRLAKTLLHPRIQEIARYFDRMESGQVRSLMSSGKHGEHVQALRAAKLAVEELFTKPAESIPPKDQHAIEAIKHQLLHSPILLAAFLEKQKSMQAAVTWAEPAEKQFFVMDETHGFLRKYWPELAAVLLPPLPEKPPEAASAKAVSSPSAEVVSELLPAPLIAPAVVIAASDALRTTTPPPKNDEERAARTKQQAAFEGARRAIIDDTELFMIQALDDGFTKFECNIDLKKNGFPILLSFANDKGEKKEFVLTHHAKTFNTHGLNLTLEDAVDLKIAVQSKVLNETGTEPMRTPGKGGQPSSVRMSQAIPLLSHDPAKRRISISRPNGTLLLQIAAPDRDNKGEEKIILNMQLGLADEPQYNVTKAEWDWIHGKNERPEHISETAERIKLILDYIAQAGKQKLVLTKRDVSEKLWRHVMVNGKEWVRVEKDFTLPDYTDFKLLHEVTDEADKVVQKISLSPVKMHLDRGGDNPSWHMDFYLYANDKPAHIKGWGKPLRGRSVNLHTSNHELAVARARQSMEGITDAYGHAPGFIELVTAHAKAQPHDRWTKIGTDQGDGTVLVGNKRAQDFMDDMLRYEHDIGVKLIKHPPQDGKVSFTLKALRAVTPSRLGNVKAEPHVICIKDGEGNRREIELTLTVPENKAEKIDDFAKKVSEAMGWYAAEAYGSIALSVNSGEDSQRKRVQQYQASTIKNLLEKAVESHFAAAFGQPYKRNGARHDIAPARPSFQARVAHTHKSPETGLGA
jgi:hypothetical protein